MDSVGQNYMESGTTLLSRHMGSKFILHFSLFQYYNYMLISYHANKKGFQGCHPGNLASFSALHL